MLKIWKMAADFRNVYRCNVSFLIGSIGGRLRTQLQPSWWRIIKFCGWYLCFSCTCMIRASSLLLSYIEGKHCECWLLFFSDETWMLQQPNRWNCRLLLQKNNFPSRPIKRLARQEVQRSRHVSWWYVPRPRLTGIRNFRSNDTVQSDSFP